MTRPLTESEMAELAAYLPTDLTTTQLGKILIAAKSACAKAFDDGRKAEAYERSIYRRCVRDDQHTETQQGEES